MAPAELDVFDLDGTDIGDGALLAGEIMPEPSDYLSEVQRDGKPLGVASWGSGGVISSGSLLSWNFAVVPCTRSERPHTVRSGSSSVCSTLLTSHSSSRICTIEPAVTSVNDVDHTLAPAARWGAVPPH